MFTKGLCVHVTFTQCCNIRQTLTLGLGLAGSLSLANFTKLIIRFFFSSVGMSLYSWIWTSTMDLDTYFLPSNTDICSCDRLFK